MPISLFSRLKSLVFRGSHRSMESLSASAPETFDVDVWGERQTYVASWHKLNIDEARRLYNAACTNYPDRTVMMRGHAGLVISVRHRDSEPPEFNTRTKPRA